MGYNDSRLIPACAATEPKPPYASATVRSVSGLYAKRYNHEPYLMIDMGTHMKTTIEISDSLFSEARLLAATEGITLRQLVEVGLRHAVAQRKRPVKPFKLRDASFGGDGLVKKLKGAGWEQIRDLVYEGRGGRPGI